MLSVERSDQCSVHRQLDEAANNAVVGSVQNVIEAAYHRTELLALGSPVM